MNRRLVWLLIAALVVIAPAAHAEDVVGTTPKVGALFDLTGPTNTIGEPFARGAMDYFNYLNGKGGINGAKIDLIVIDYQYDAQKSLAGFTRLATSDKIVGLMGWGSVDIPLLKPRIAEFGIPTISSAARGYAVIGQPSPYLFALAGTYADELLALMQWAKSDATKRNIKAPKAAILYTEPGRGDLQRLKDLKAFDRLGFELVAEEFISVRAVSASTQVARINAVKPDYLFTLVTAEPQALILREMKGFGLDIPVLANFFGGNETLLNLVGDAAKNLYVTSPVAFFAQTDLPGIKLIHEVSKKDQLSVQYMAGWSGAMVLGEGLRRAQLKPQMSVKDGRAALKTALESLRDFDMQGVSLPMTFSGTNRVGTSSFMLYRADVPRSTFKFQANVAVPQLDK